MIPPISGGDSGRYLEQDLAFCLHEVDSFTDVYADDTLITNAQITAVSGNSNDGKVTATKYANAMWIRRYAGTSSQTVDYILNNRYPTVFTSDFRGRGIAHAAMTFDWGDGKLYQGPPIMTFLVKGKKCYDPRLDVSAGASPTNPSYIAWTTNPALCWADYAMADYGGAVPSTGINWASVVAAANICDALVNIPGATTQKRYTFNGRVTLPIDPDWRENAKLFIDAMLGRMVRRDGIWFIYAGAYDAPSYTIEKVDWLSIDSIKTVAPRDGGRWNTVRCWYVDPSRNWQRVECYPRRNATYKSADGAEEITLEMEQPSCTDEYEAQRKAELMLRQSRNQIGLTGRLPPRFRKMATGETVAVNFEELGWVSKIMRIRTMDLLPDGSVNVGLAEEQEADWADLLAAEYNAPSSSTVPATNPTTPQAPSSLTLTSTNVAGTLLFDIGDPVVRPIGTRFQLIRSAVSSDASVGTVAYDGALQRGAAYAPSSTLYYFARAYAGSYFGPYYPNTTGIAASPLVVQDRITLNPLVTGSWAVHNAEIVSATTYTPDANGLMSVSAVIEGTASFDKDSGTFFNIVCAKTSLTTSALYLTVNASSAAYGGVYGYFTSSSAHQFATLVGNFDMSSGTNYTIGVQGFRSAGALNIFNAVLTSQFTRY